MINGVFIEKENIIFNDSANNKYYQNIIYGGKKFYLMTNKNNIEKCKQLYYYCSNHRTSKFSGIFDNNNKKKRISICDGKILYDKTSKNFYFMKVHSDRCKEIMKQKFDNYQSINLEISNYKNFRDNLIEFLKLNPIIM